MDDLKIEPTRHQPKVDMLFTSREITFEGRLVMPDSVAFFQPINNWISEFKSTASKELTLHLKLDYFNTSASKQLISMLHVLKEMQESGCNIVVNWYYNSMEDDVLEVIKETEDVVDLKFNKIAI